MVGVLKETVGAIAMIRMRSSSPVRRGLRPNSALRIVTATRSEAEFKSGVSVRGGLALRTAAQARALVHGRDFVLPDDVVQLVTPILGHRLGLARQTSDALEERRAVVTVLRRILTALPLPT
jgi:MoxR-like ATPase